MSGYGILHSVLLWFSVMAAGCGESIPQNAVIAVLPQEKFQIISGWEATAQAGQDHSKFFDSYKDKLFDEAVNDLGINRLRLEIRSGLENPVDYYELWQSGKITEKEYNAHRNEIINDNDDPRLINPGGFKFSELDSTMEKVVLPIKKRLESRREKLFLNLNYVDFDNKGESNLQHSRQPEEYAEFMLAAFQYLQKKYGFVPNAVEVVLEPDNHTDWRGANIGEAIVATANLLQKNGFDPEFIAPSTTNAANAPIYFDEIARVPNAMNHLDEISYHRYCCASKAVLTRIVERAEKYDKRTSMLEWIGANHETLHEDLKLGRNSAWQQFTLAFPNVPDNGAQYFLVSEGNKAAPSFGSRTPLLRQYFRYIRAGAQRVGTKTSNENFDPLAFVNQNGKTVVVIKAASAGSITIENLASGTYGASYTTDTQKSVNLTDKKLESGDYLTVEIPASGVITVYEK